MPRAIPHSVFLDWPEDDQDKALAYMRDQAERCGGCGTKRSEWESDHFAYVGHVEVCPGCEAIAQEHENIDNAAKTGADTKGLRVGLVTQATADLLERAGVTDPLGG